MNNFKRYLPWAVRIIIFGLFLLSAVAKIYKIWAFEKQLVDLGITDWCVAPYLARLIIALEIAIGIAILQANYLKRIVIPVTVLLLVAFCAHLGIEIARHGNNGNCGCFGQLIKMTPLEAIIKNILTIGLLVYLYFNVTDKPKGENKFSVLALIYACSALLMFMFYPFCPCKKNVAAVPVSFESDSSVKPIEESLKIADSVTDKKDKKEEKKDTVAKKAAEPEPKKVTSKYSKLNVFSGKAVDVDKGKKTLCFFAPGCDHCRAAAKELCALARQGKIPPMYIYFMDEEAEKIPDFFKEAGNSVPYQVLDPGSFWNTLGWGKQTPGVLYLWNGNEMKFFDGIEGNKFIASEYVKACEKKYVAK